MTSESALLASGLLDYRTIGDINDMKTKNLNYTVLIDFSEEDGCYVARVPALKYCTAVGDTYEEAAHEIHVAIEGWLAVAKEAGTPIPEPGPGINDLQSVSDLLNMGEIARILGISAQTLHSRLRRGTELGAKDRKALERRLQKAGIRLVPHEA